MDNIYNVIDGLKAVSAGRRPSRSREVAKLTQLTR